MTNTAEGIYFGKVIVSSAQLLEALTPFIKNPTDPEFLKTFGEATGVFLEETAAALDRLRDSS